MKGDQGEEGQIEERRRGKTDGKDREIEEAR